MAYVLSATVFAEEKEQKERDFGHVSGSFETNTNVYLKDVKTNATVPDGRFGSNNYLKVDYNNRRFTAGMQLEAYAPVAVGYPNILKGAALTNYYIGWTDECFSVTAGTFYEQFGSGLLFRSWEDRALGLNNSIMGARVSYNFRDIVAVKALWGMPRFGMKFSDTQVKGADASFAISNLVGWDNVYLAVEGSVLDRYEKLNASMEAEALSPNRLGYSARVNLDVNGYYFRGEYVQSGNKYFDVRSFQDQYDEPYLTKKGNAQLIETGYTGKGLGVSLSLRRLEWMDSKIVADGGAPEVNMMNYVPALCTQYTYNKYGSGLPYKYAGTLENAQTTQMYARDYMSLKFRPAQGNCVDYSVGVAAEHPLMRVEEMYFLKMEALAHSNLAGAVDLLESFMNTYRYSDGSYKCEAADLDEFLKEMMVQKRIEFWGEGVLIYDYKRLNMGIIRDYKGSVVTNYTDKDYLINTTGRSPQWNFCIPLSELQTNLGITADDNNPDPTGFTGEPQVTL